MSLYLFWMREDVMGTDYAMVSAIGVFYVLPERAPLHHHARNT